MLADIIVIAILVVIVALVIRTIIKSKNLPLKLHLPASVTIGGCMSKEAIEQKEVIVGKLKDSGCRITKQRLILLDVILEGECGSCKEIYYRASKIDHSIGTATVYRMINTLEEIGAIDRKNMYRVQVS